jgi:hypothetical protein
MEERMSEVIPFNDSVPRCAVCHRAAHDPGTWQGHHYVAPTIYGVIWTHPNGKTKLNATQAIGYADPLDAREFGREYCKRNGGTFELSRNSEDG